MNTDPITTPDFLHEDQRPTRFTPETKVTLDLSGIPAKAQQAISAWLSEKDQQAIVDALAAMARRVDEELNGVHPGAGELTSEIMVIPSLKSDSFMLSAPADMGRKAA